MPHRAGRIDARNGLTAIGLGHSCFLGLSMYVLVPAAVPSSLAVVLASNRAGTKCGEQGKGTQEPAGARPWIPRCGFAPSAKRAKQVP